MGYYRRSNKNGYGTHEVYRQDRNKDFVKKKTDLGGTNDKLKMLGALFIAGFRANEEKGTPFKQIRFYLFEDKETHSHFDEKNYDRTYLSVHINSPYLSYHFNINTNREVIRGRKKSQIVKV